MQEAILFSCKEAKMDRVVFSLNNFSSIGIMLKRYVQDVFGLTDHDIVNIKYDYNKGTWFCRGRVANITGTFKRVEISTV